MENNSIIWEENFHIRILSLNTSWNLNKSEIYKIPVLKNIF